MVTGSNRRAIATLGRKGFSFRCSTSQRQCEVAKGSLPGATHDLTAVRTHGIPAALAADDIKCWADKAYQGAGPAIRVPVRGKHLRGRRRRHNRDHAKIRSLGERAMAILKSWRLLRKLRCSTTRITAAVRAVVALELTI
ncbi:transposase family protein [Streptomyces qaidamensis]|uniref:transposase family protein n=1 Tax=Streptomyces qaidamensis TaxID=1783515 RepID=UPI0036E47A70